MASSSRRRVGWNLPTRSASPHYAEACHFLLLLILHLLANLTTQRACLLLWRKRFRTDDVIDDRPYLLLTGDESQVMSSHRECMPLYGASHKGTRLIEPRGLKITTSKNGSTTGY